MARISDLEGSRTGLPAEFLSSQSYHWRPRIPGRPRYDNTWAAGTLSELRVSGHQVMVANTSFQPQACDHSPLISDQSGHSCLGSSLPSASMPNFDRKALGRRYVACWFKLLNTKNEKNSCPSHIETKTAKLLGPQTARNSPKQFPHKRLGRFWA